MKKSFIIASALVALAVPPVASASQPVTPGGFGTERASNIKQFHSGDGSRQLGLVRLRPRR